MLVSRERFVQERGRRHNTYISRPGPGQIPEIYQTSFHSHFCGSCNPRYWPPIYKCTPKHLNFYKFKCSKGMPILREDEIT